MESVRAAHVESFPLVFDRDDELGGVPRTPFEKPLGGLKEDMIFAVLRPALACLVGTNLDWAGPRRGQFRAKLLNPRAADAQKKCSLADRVPPFNGLSFDNRAVQSERASPIENRVLGQFLSESAERDAQTGSGRVGCAIRPHQGSQRRAVKVSRIVAKDREKQRLGSRSDHNRLSAYLDRGFAKRPESNHPANYTIRALEPRCFPAPGFSA